MFWKFWLPALMMFGVYFLGRRQARRTMEMDPLSPSPERSAVLRFREVHQRSFRTTALTLVTIVLIWMAWYIYQDWNTAHQVVEVRVIHVQTMQTTVYQAQRNKIQGRTFHTLDGRRITLADVERMEITDPP
ncbi:MAG: hypothetical protein HQL98_03310 [Magnetococcales bacterium]|nr:hypothetical protein [Magnetococcales bacterium]